MNVSVIIPCHDLGEFIEECVESVVAQNVPESEIIVVDDASTDPNTLQVLNRLPVRFPGVSVARVEYHNAGLTRNAGFALSSGDFILFLDADDMLGEHFLRATLETLTHRPDCGVAFTDAELFGQVTGMWYTGPLLFASEIYLGNYLHYCSLIRRSVIETHGGFNSNVQSTEDWDLWIKLHSAGVRFIKTSGVRVRYRKRADSLLTQNASRRPSLINQVILNHKEVYSRLFLCPIGDREEKHVRALLQASTGCPQDGNLLKRLRRTRLYRQFKPLNLLYRVCQKTFAPVDYGSLKERAWG